MEGYEDNYNHITDDNHYIVESIPGGNNEIEELFNVQLTRCCSCSIICNIVNNCLCLSNSDNYVQTTNSEMVLTNTHNNSDALFECNSLCQCSKNCGNRLVQFGPRKNLVINNCFSDNQHSKGYGLFTKESILKGAFICEYAGEVITENDAKKRHEENLKNKRSNYIFCLNEHSNNTLFKTFVDPSKFGNIGRYLNHSCDPNCFIIPIRIEHAIPKLCIFTKRYIQPKEELTYDYSSGSSSNLKKIDLPNIKCLCMAKNCRGYLPFEDY